VGRRSGVANCGKVTRRQEIGNESGFVYSAKMDGRNIQEIKGFLEELPREGVEVLFANYVAEKQTL
jgi:hypothetical protein